MYVTLNFDVEDTAYPPEADTDGIAAWLARGLSQARLRGTFHVIGDKARAILERGRTDVSSALAAFGAACYGHTFAQMRLRRARRYPPIAHELAQAMTWIEVSSFFGPEFSAEKLRLHMRLQSWTLKPARERALLGPYGAAAALVPRQLPLQQRS